MSTQVLKDRHFKIIGYIETRPDGTQVAKDEHYSIKGYYDPKTNQTKDVHYSIVGRGNLLASLVTCSG